MSRETWWIHGKRGFLDSKGYVCERRNVDETGVFWQGLHDCDFGDKGEVVFWRQEEQGADNCSSVALLVSAAGMKEKLLSYGKVKI